ncbi:MAG: hypothetical protein OER88_14010, partial [Planctomycetota bacterium]|nr:hypothetical protein [Planctomycetota bacterium]
MAKDWEFGSAPTDPTANAQWHADRGEAQRQAQAQSHAQPAPYALPTIPTTTGTRGGGGTGVHPYDEHEWMGVAARLLAVVGFLVGAFWAGS